MIEITYEFWFDAAHQFPHMPAGHKYRGLHGHSFRAEIAVTGKPDPKSGFIVDFGELEAAGEDIRERLDHRFLNEIEGLESPSLEHIARYIWTALKPRFSGLSRVAIRRDSHRHGCVYTGEPVADEAPLAADVERVVHA
jgi:6-pyruvoyltetrahydropterin/6-carboxytetrahydropterin synthase